MRLASKSMLIVTLFYNALFVGCGREPEGTINLIIPSSPVLRTRISLNNVATDLSKLAKDGEILINTTFIDTGDNQRLSIEGIIVSNGVLSVSSQEGVVKYCPRNVIISGKSGVTNQMFAPFPSLRVECNSDSAKFLIPVVGTNLHMSIHNAQIQKNGKNLIVPLQIKFSDDFKGTTGRWYVYRQL